MKKLTLESFFHPGEHDNQGNPNDSQPHRYPREKKTGGGTFPYTQETGEVLQDEEIEEELGLDESLSLTEFYKAGKTMPGTDAMSYGKVQNSGGGHGGGKSSKGWQGAGRYPKFNEEDPVEEDKNRAMPIDWINNPGEEGDFEEFDEYFGISEAIGISARERATKEMGPVSTKQPWKNGAPGSDYNLTTRDDSDPKAQKEKLEDEIGLSLESITRKIVKEYSSYSGGDSGYHKMMMGKKVKGQEDDLHFFDNMQQEHPFLMTSEKEFRESERDRKKGDDEEAEEEV